MILQRRYGARSHGRCQIELARRGREAALDRNLCKNAHTLKCVHKLCRIGASRDMGGMSSGVLEGEGAALLNAPTRPLRPVTGLTQNAIVSIS